MIYAFGKCELDAELFQLRREGSAVKLEPKIFNVLAYLVEHRDRVVVKDELLDRLWPAQAVSESVLPSCIAAIRRAVGDTGKSQQVIQTVHGRGYRFVAAVSANQAESGLTPSPYARPPDGLSPETPAPLFDELVHPSPLFGREKAMERLRAGLELAVGGSGRLTLLVGEPGIGKTRTAEELLAHASGLGLTVLVGRAYEGEGAPAFWPWVQILRRLVTDTEPARLAADMGSGAADIAELVPEIRDRLPGIPFAEAVEGEQARFRLFDSLTAFFKAVARRVPLVMLIDDLHWADVASLRFTGFLARELRDARILLVGTYRDVELKRGHPLSELLAALARESVYEHVLLRGLDEADTGSIVDHVLGAPAPEHLSSAVHEMTEGNPFFIQEVVRLLAGQGDAAADVDPSSLRLALPQSVRDAIGRRLDGLSAECNRLLRAASVLGRQFTVTLLGRVADLPTDVVIALLAEASAEHVVDADRDAPGRYAFRHALIRQTLYDELSQPDRLRLHRQAGEVIEEASGAHPEPFLAELAHHFYQAAPGGDVRKAVDTCVRAAESAGALLAYEQSVLLYERALSALDLEVERDQVRRCELLLALGEAASASGAGEKTLTSFRDAADIARRISRVDLLARAALGYRGPYDMGGPADDLSLSLLDEALAAVGQDYPGYRARLLSRLAGAPPHSSSMARRDELSAEAYELALLDTDPVVRRDALSARLWACLGPDRVDEKLRIGDELLAFARDIGEQRVALLGLEALVGGHLLLGDAPSANRFLEEFSRIAARLRQPAFLQFAAVSEGSRELYRGNFTAAERKMKEALEHGWSIRRFAHFIFAGQTHAMLITRGDMDGLTAIDDLIDEMLELPYSWVTALRSNRALASVYTGDVEQARSEFAEITRQDVVELPRDEHWLVTIAALAGLAEAFEDRDCGAKLYDLLLPYAHLMIVHDLLRSVLGAAASILGRLATLLDRFDEGVTHFDAAIARETTMGARPALLTTKAAYARVLRRRATTGDAERAEKMAREIETEARALGMGKQSVHKRILREAGLAGPAETANQRP